ncbi:MAG: hypothetical protein ACRDJW_07570, partial [Thermomicrobiales bacterium]
AVCDPAEFCPGTGPDCPPNAFAGPATVCETGNLCTADICNGQGLCIEGTPVACPNPEQTCIPGTGACVCPTGQPLDCGTFCGVECCVNSQCTPTELCNADGVCVQEGIDLVGIGQALTVDDDIRIIVNGTTVVDDNDGVITTYPPFNLSLNNGDQLCVAADNVIAGRRRITPYQLLRPSDGAVQVLDPVGVDFLEIPFGPHPVVLGEFYNQCFTVNLPPRT